MPSVVQVVKGISGGGSVTVTPAATTAGNLLVCLVSGGGYTAPPTYTTPSGWTLLDGKTNAVYDNFSASVFYIANAASISTLTITAANANGLAAVFYEVSGAPTASPIDAHAAYTTAAGATSHSLPITTTAANDLVLGLLVVDYAQSGNETTANPSGWTSDVQSYIDTNGFVAVGTSHETAASAGGVTYTPTWGTTAVNAIQFALAILAAGATGDTLSGTLAGVGNVTAGLSVSHTLSGTLSGVGNVAAPLSVSHPLAGTLAGEGNLAASLSVAHLLSGTLSGEGGAAASLGVSHLLAGTFSGEGDVSGTLAGGAALSGALSGEGDIAGTLAVSHLLAGTLSGEGSATGSLTVGSGLSGTLSGVGTLQGTLGVSHSLGGTLAGEGSAQGTLSVSHSLAGMLSGEGDATGSLHVSHLLAGTLVGAGGTTGGLTVSHALSGVLGGVGALTGSLTAFIPFTPPLVVSFAAQGLLVATFAAVGRLSALFTRKPNVPNPNSTLTSTMTARDSNGTLLSTLSLVAVTVTFPDGSTQTFALPTTVTNAGNGQYSITYTTKGIGECLEEWTFTAADGVTKGDFRNVTPVSY